MGGDLNAPMPGRIVKVLVASGDHVEAAAPLVVMEAMKMEYTIKAPTAGTIAHVCFSEGDQVAQGTPLVEMQ
jgi:3-methylcrotonyl-CoA carboxylase alpha subunit